jgi:AraC-like DNA-binding protein
MDVLADVLRVIQLSGGVFIEADFSEPWCLSGKVSPEDCRAFMRAPRHVMGMHYVVSGRMLLQAGESKAVEVGAGEVVLLPHNHAHLFGSSLDVPPVRAGDIVQPGHGGGLFRIVHGGGGSMTRVLCGYLGCDLPFNPLLAVLPPVLTINARALPSGMWIETSFRLGASKTAASREGADLAIARLAELVFAEAVQQFLAILPGSGGGWLAGLQDPYVGRALGLLHAQLTRKWTADSLAGQVGLSRSAFAERFASLVGQPPIQYLGAWRMHVAAQRLRAEHASIAQVGFGVGYESEAAFSRAFKRQFGVSPDAWRRGAG